jgi:phage tail P2-like protein
MSNDLLPLNATQLERNLSETIARLSNVDVTNVSALWNADTCPLYLLPWLAWAEQVPNWTSNWTEVVQRTSIKTQRAIRKKRGTKQAVVDAVASFGGTAVIREWFEMSPVGTPHTFDVVITGGADYIEAGLQTAMINSINDVKPMRSHYTLGVGLVSVAPLYMSGVGQVVNYHRLQFTD